MKISAHKKSDTVVIVIFGRVSIMKDAFCGSDSECPLVVNPDTCAHRMSARKEISVFTDSKLWLPILFPLRRQSIVPLF